MVAYLAFEFDCVFVVVWCVAFRKSGLASGEKEEESRVSDVL